MSVEQDRSAVVVVGMHRSGTSLVTRLASLWGLQLPCDDIGAQRGNERGHWESRAVIELNEWLLSESGTSWAEVQVPDVRSASTEVRKRFSEALEHGYPGEAAMLIKDPRISKLTSTWADSLRALDIEPSFLLMIRNPIEVAESLYERDALPKEQGALLWLLSVLQSELATRGESRAVVDFGDILKDWKGVLAPVASRIFPEGHAEITEPEIGDSVVDPALHHHVVGRDRSIGCELGQWVERAYAALLELTVDHDSERARQRLDRLRGEVAAAGPLLRSSLPTVEGELRQQLAQANVSLSAANELHGRVIELEQVALAHREAHEHWLRRAPQIERREERLAAIESSRSWRLMWTVLAPYRQLRHRLNLRR